jgi:16S rRNA (uracil1498-N3)-methyltransferase
MNISDWSKAPVFYCTTLNQESFLLGEEETAHCIRVLRMRQGEKVRVVNGNGSEVFCEIADPNPSRCGLLVLETAMDRTRPDYSVHIAMAPPKSADRLEWFLEKATEIGIDRITPLRCDRSERRDVKPDRLHKVLVSAMKQSGRAFLPQLSPMVAFRDFVVGAGTDEAKFIAHCADKPPMHLGKMLKKHSPITIMIGPEGDFTSDEISLAHAHAFLSAGLGEARLRTETAALAATMLVHCAHL